MPFGPEYRAQLASHDRHWAWKLGLRLLLILIDLVVVGLVGWATADGLKQYGDIYDIWDSDVIPWDFIPVGASLIWCAIVVLIHLLRKIPVHPGVEVGLDLILWLAFAILAAFTFVAAVEVVGYKNSYSIDGFGSDSGYYTTAANGTQVYVTPNNRDDCPRFDSCADESSFLDSVTHRGVVELTAGAMMIAALILHFTLFVWACVDTATRNSSKVHREAKDIADAMIAEMVARGQLPPPQQPLLIPSQRGSQVVSEAMSRENSAVFMTPAGGYHGAQSSISSQAQSQQIQMSPMAQAMMPPQSTSPQLQQQGRSASPAFLAVAQAGPSTQTEKSEEGSSQNGNSSGWHTPPTQPGETSHGYAVVPPDDPDAIRPIPPVRAPGHTYSPTGSVSLQNSMQNF
ncbi:hypothetical protein NA57DRAFT_60746 [Rhizodiscina lignyota]|uniref:Uncharacterized protein n=1 Tax=Rhizodiscina lignyota TaxID=1504668 RepID=A0A9P4I6J9_9PEZI|nr:hypothetical protein NA57DRAFT_60746 [Rhizodiscina lignyota]